VRSPQTIEERADRTWSARVLLTYTGVVLAALIALVAVLVWASSRGFEIEDEGYLMLAYAHPSTSAASSQWDQVMSALVPGSPASIQDYRLIRLGIDLVTAALLGAALIYFVRRRLPIFKDAIPSPITTVGFVAITGLLAYAARLPQTVSYNDLNAGLLNLECAIVLVALAYVDLGQQGLVKRWLPGAILGLLVSVQVFVKFPTALLMIVLILGFWFVMERRREASLYGITLVAFVGVGVALMSLGPFSAHRLVLGSQTQSESGLHSVSNLVATYLKPLYPPNTFSPVLVVCLTLLVASGTVIWRLDDRRRQIIAWLAAAIGVVGAAAGYVALGYQRPELWTGAFAALSLTGCIVWWRARRARTGLRADPAAGQEAANQAPRRSWQWQTAWTIAFLFLAAVAGAVGSSNAPSYQMMVNAAPLGAAFILGIGGFARSAADIRQRALILLPVAVLAGAFAGQSVIGTVVDPFRLQGLRAQDQAVADAAPLKGITVDQETRVFYERLIRQVETKTDFRPGEPVVAVDDMAGAIYALGGYGPGSNWVSESDAPVACNAWKDDPEAVRAARLVLLRSEPASKLRRCLARVWPAFPNGMRRVATIESPFGYSVGVLVPRRN
jgi:hypothetical protein